MVTVNGESRLDKYPVWNKELLMDMLFNYADDHKLVVEKPPYFDALDYEPEDFDIQRLEIKTLTTDADESFQLLIVHGKEGEFEPWTVGKLKDELSKLSDNAAIQVQFTDPDTDECGKPVWHDFDYVSELYDNANTVVLVVRARPTME